MRIKIHEPNSRGDIAGATWTRDIRSPERQAVMLRTHPVRGFRVVLGH